MLESLFYELAGRYTSRTEIIDECWREIEARYSSKGRYYHNLSHLQTLLQVLLKVRSRIEDWDSMVFAVRYHDIIYSVLKQNNEAKSAQLAAKRLLSLQYPQDRIARVTRHIIATKAHQQAEDPDTNILTDADLSILGADDKTYQEYAVNVRKEYSLYPDLLYNAGRKKVLHHFLCMKPLFKTDYFISTFEQQARRNLKNELFVLEES